MKFLEKDLEQVIMETSDDVLESRGLPLCGKRYRQLRIGNYGISDLITINREYYTHTRSHVVMIDVYELKLENYGVSAFFQAINYAKGIQRFIKKRHSEGLDFIVKININLVGKNLDKSGGLCYIPDLFYATDSMENIFIRKINFYEYKFKIDGLHFEKQHGYKLTNEGF